MQASSQTKRLISPPLQTDQLPRKGGAMRDLPYRFKRCGRHKAGRRSVPRSPPKALSGW